MSLLSSIINKVKNEVAGKVAEAVVGEILGDKPQTGSQSTAYAPSVEHKSAPSELDEGCGYYDRIPAEECQYNYNGNYVDYFRMIFREDFAGYEAKYSELDIGRRSYFTLERNGRIELVVELMTEKSEANKLRNDCKETGTPYLRFYFDHFGWWNTRTYVRERVRGALGISSM